MDSADVPYGTAGDYADKEDIDRLLEESRAEHRAEQRARAHHPPAPHPLQSGQAARVPNCPKCRSYMVEKW
eukprot:3178899-Heterocapsa_arctica.AAC.1